MKKNTSSVCSYPNSAGDAVSSFTTPVFSPPSPSLPCSNSSETVEVARIALRLPPFWKSNVRLWIAQCDHAFTFSGISSDDTKYSALVANLDAETLSYVSGIVLSPPNSDKYHTLSQRLITQFSDSETQKIKKLLTDFQLGDEKPSHLLRKMKELSNGQLQDDFLQSLWLQRMPPHIQTVLSASSESLDKLAIIADKVSEVVGASSTICAAKPVPPPSQSSSCSAQPTMDSLAKQIQELSLQVAELTRERNSSRHQRYSSDRRRSHSCSRSVNRGSGICYYHRRYKEQARKCVSPCAFVQKTNSGSEICVIPPSPTMNKSPQSTFSLFAANNTKIPAYGIIRPSKSPWNSPLHVVPKSDSTVRPVGDYRQLNSVTEFDSYPMPYLNDFAHALHGKRIFSKIDIFKAFHQIPIAECDIPKTAATTPWGLYEYTHLCFGLVNAPQTFMRFMHAPLPDKVQAVLDYKQPETVGSLRKILGLLNFYRRFLPKAAEQQYLLSEFLKGSKGKDSKPLNWSSEAITAFQRCKQALADAALLSHPSPSAPLALHVDASDYAIGGALPKLWTLSYSHWLSFPENLLHLKSLTVPTTVNSLLSTRLSDTFGICWKLEISQCLLTTSPSLMLLGKKSDKCSPRQIRQLDFISQFTTNIVHIPGSDNIAADVLSRVSAITFPSQIDYDCIAETQQTDQELHT
ncbi:hypothetical protein TNCV_1190701 [Trichonephila clavipes]|nr:hypothetical protein TNCV_1190701 [Trichonephila clavipes]